MGEKPLADGDTSLFVSINLTELLYSYTGDSVRSFLENIKHVVSGPRLNNTVFIGTYFCHIRFSRRFRSFFKTPRMTWSSSFDKLIKNLGGHFC